MIADNCTFPAIALLDVMVSVFPDVLTFTSLLDDVKLNFDRTLFLSVSFSTYCLPFHFSSWGALSVLPDAKLGMVSVADHAGNDLVVCCRYPAVRPAYTKAVINLASV